MLISVITPAYNAGKYISESIKSVIAQTYKYWELIIADDGSTDNTKNLVQTFKETDSRIKYYYHQNSKQGKTRNLALSQAKGSLIAFLDADDLWTPDKLEKQVSCFLKNHNLSVCFTGGYFLNNERNNSEDTYDSASGFFSGNEMYKLQFKGNYIPVLSVMMTRQLVDLIGLQEEHLFFQGCEDWDYWLRAAKAGANFYGLKDFLFYYRRHESNMSSDKLAMRLAKTCVFIKNFDNNRFSTQETRTIFKPLVVPLVIDLLLKRKIKEASFVLRQTFKKIPILYLKFSYALFILFGRASMKPILQLDRIDTRLHGNKLL